jgi:hypothetical protein
MSGNYAAIPPLISHRAPDTPYWAAAGSGGGGSSYPSVASFSTVTVSSFTKTNSIFSSTSVLSLPPNTSTLALQFPDNIAFAGLWNFTATIADGTDPPKAAGAVFSVAAASSGGSNYYSYATVANGSNNVYNWSMFAPATANTPPQVYIENPTGNTPAASLAWLQMG